MRLGRVAQMAFFIALAGMAVAQDGSLGRKKGGSTSPSQPEASNPQQAPAPRTPNVKRIPASEKNDEPTQRKIQSRSGKVEYKSSNNNVLRQRDNERVVIRTAPEPSKLASLRNQVRREDRGVQINYSSGNFRVGYTHWDRNWTDNSFYYPHYVFNPYGTACVISPWYYYAQLPPYISFTRIVYAQAPYLVFVGNPYDWYQPSRRSFYDRDDRYDRDRYDDRRYSDLDYAIDDLVRAFETGDGRMVERLVPRSGRVTVGIDNTVTYSLDTNDFYDMLVDAVESSRTIDYAIEDVRVNRDEAQVLARHEFRDSWGQRVTVYHRILFQEERGRLLIRFFNSGNDRFF